MRTKQRRQKANKDDSTYFKEQRSINRWTCLALPTTNEIKKTADELGWGKEIRKNKYRGVKGHT